MQWLVPTETGFRYRVEDTDVLGPNAVWQPMTEFDGDGEVRRVVDARPHPVARFYRLIVTTP